MQRPPPPPPPLPVQHAVYTLPPGWLEYYTHNGKPYWFNTISKETTWEPPTMPAVPPVKAKKTKKKIPGTDWLLVTAEDGTDFYYNKSTKTSVWEMPKELEEPIAKMIEQEKEERKRTRLEMEKDDHQPQATSSDGESKRQKVETSTAEVSTEMTEEDILWQMQNMDPEELAALGLEHEQEEQQQVEEQEQIEEQEQKQENDQRQQPMSSIETSLSSPQATVNEQADDQKDTVDEQSEGEKVELFTQMLTEKDISPFASWEQELPRLITDARYNLVQPHSKRKALFNNYCRVLALERKKANKEKPNTKTPEDEYKDLLEEMVTGKMYWDDFRRKAKNDPRFKLIRESKLRETLFKDYIKQLPSKSKPIGRTTLSSPPPSSTSAHHQHSSTVKDRYLQLLKEQQVHAGMRWRDAKRILEHDDRYHDIESKIVREDLFRDYLESLQQPQQ